MSTIAKGGAGYQIGDGNLNEVKMSVQPPHAAFTAAAILPVSALVSGIITYDSATGANLQLPPVSELSVSLGNAKLNSSFEFSVIALGDGTATLTTNTGWTLVGSGAVAKGTAGRFRARKTGESNWVLYQIA